MSAPSVAARVIPGSTFEAVHYPDDELRLRVADGEVQVTEYISTDRTGPPPHSHPWTEVEYVIEGVAEFFVNGEWVQAGPGAVQLLPAGAPHSVRIPEGTARILMITIGAPFAPMARELAELYATGAADLTRIVEIAHRHGLRLAEEGRVG